MWTDPSCKYPINYPREKIGFLASPGRKSFQDDELILLETVAYQIFTPRERVILKHITYGQSNKEIAAELYITEKTVKTHITSIFGKMEVQDRTQAAIHALKHRWFEA